MKKYQILDTENTRDFAFSLICMTFEGETEREYINLHTCDGDLLFAVDEVKEVNIINDMELFLKDGDLQGVVGLLDRYYQDTKNKNILELINDKYITGDMVVLINKNNFIQLESAFEVDNSKYTYYEHNFKGDNGNIEIHEIKELTEESIINMINELKTLNIA